MKYFFLLFSILVQAQQIQNVDFISAKAHLTLNEKNKVVSGTVEYEFNVVSLIDSIRIDAKNMKFTNVFINQKQVLFKNSGKELILFEGYKKGGNTLRLFYESKPTQTLYFIGSKFENNLQIWTQGQGKYTSYWLPSFDDVNEKMIFETSITFDATYKVISNGLLSRYEKTNGDEGTWYYNMKKPMASYLVMLTIGKFDFKSEKSKSGIGLENYFQSKDSLKFESTYRYSKQIFDFLESEIGVQYPWEIYRQIPIEDFLYAGMENTTSTLFSQDFVVDKTGFNDRNYSNVNAHELAHHWFGNLVTATSGKHHWLQEGFATFYALLAGRKLFGDAYFYNQMYLNAQQVKQASKKDTIPIMSEKASSLSFYQKGSLALFFIYETVGSKNFQKIVKNYLSKYKYKNVETKDFLNEIVKVVHFDCEAFEKNWLQDYKFPDEEINNLLGKSTFIKKLYEIKNRKTRSFAENEPFFNAIMTSNNFYALKTEIIYQIKNIPFDVKAGLIRVAMKTDDLEVHKAIAETIDSIPITFKTDYELLLDDNSYEIKELALFRLFNQFTENQVFYLEKAKNWKGNNDLNLRIMFLFLSQLSSNLEAIDKQKYKAELIGYTSSKYESAIRKNAFDVALQLKLIDDKVLENLVNATLHFKWQFSKYARDFLRKLLKISSFRDRFESIKMFFLDENRIRLQQFLDEKTK